jgi:hypothetical protein
MFGIKKLQETIDRLGSIVDDLKHESRLQRNEIIRLQNPSLCPLLDAQEGDFVRNIFNSEIYLVIGHTKDVHSMQYKGMTEYYCATKKAGLILTNSITKKKTKEISYDNSDYIVYKRAPEFSSFDKNALLNKD